MLRILPCELCLPAEVKQSCGRVRLCCRSGVSLHHPALRFLVEDCRRPECPENRQRRGLQEELSCSSLPSLLALFDAAENVVKPGNASLLLRLNLYNLG